MADAQKQFTYNQESGLCLDVSGQVGFNTFNPDSISYSLQTFTTPLGIEKEISVGVDAECINFHGFDFTKIVGANYFIMKDWNLKGSNLNGSKANFNIFANADLRGTKFNSFGFGYGFVFGKTDENTVSHDSCSEAILEIPNVYVSGLEEEIKKYSDVDCGF
jgi:hypothetical protein